MKLRNKQNEEDWLNINISYVACESLELGKCGRVIKTLFQCLT